MAKMRIRQTGTVADLAKNPLAAMALGSMFAGSKFRRGMPRAIPRYSLLQSETFDGLDEINREHVRASLRYHARKHQCSISDLGWALAPQLVNGIHPVLVRKWEDIERQEWQETHGP